MAALALPAMAHVTALKGQQAPANVDRDEVVTDFTSLKPFTGIIKAPKLNRADDVVFECGFETDAELAQWQIIDADGDGNNWVQEQTTYAHTGDFVLSSYSYQGGAALTPDNWVISPSLPLGGTLTIWAENWSGYYPDKFAVYVCVGDPTNLDNFVKVSDDITPPASWTQYDIDLGAYSGQEGVFALRHSGVTDMFKIFIDDISLTAPKAAMPQNVAVVPAATTADVTWENEGNVAWNLRYRQVNPKPETFWDFEDGTLGSWTTVDADGDTYTWGIWDPISNGYQPSADGMIGNMCATSASYAGDALTPDNWLISPKVTINGPLSFYAAGQDPSWAGEVFAVYVLVGENADPTDVSSFVKISDDITAESPIKQYTFDLSAYEGQEGYVAIRHYNITDMFRLNIDDIMIGEWAGEAEWIYVNDLNATNYTIEGLTPETTYEVQVQGIDEEESLSSWTESVEFTTLAGEPEVKFYAVGGFNGWNADTPLEITENGATFDVVEDPDDVESKEFKILTAGENDWLWLGGIDENGVNYFEITEGMMTAGTEITLDDAGANFRLPGSGNYTITLAKEADPTGAKAPYEGVKIVVKQNNTTPTAITDVNSKAVKSVKYVNIAGMESNVPFDGVNIVVTTYTDGTKAAAKVIK